MRIPSGVTDQGLYFVAVDGTDYVTRETGLATWTVVRSRNGAADVTMTTPTITEIDASTMPGVYFLLCDEDMTLAAGNHSEAMVYHITHAGMAPVTTVIELYRPDVTAGETLNVSSGALNAISDGLLTAGKFAAGAFDAVWSVATRLLTAGTNIVLAKGTGVTGFNDLSAAQVNAEVDTALADYDAPTNTEMTSAFTEIKGATFDTTDTLEAIRNRGDVAWTTATGFSTHSAADVWSVGTRVLTAGTNIVLAKGTGVTGFNDLSAAQVNSEVDTALADYDGPTNAEMVARTLASASYATATAQTTAQNDLDILTGADGVTLATSQPNYAPATAAALTTVDTVVDAIKAKTDSLTFTVSGKLDANITHVNELAIDGAGTEENPWGPA